MSILSKPMWAMLSASLIWGCNNNRSARDQSDNSSFERALLRAAGDPSAAGAEQDLSPLALLPGYEDVYKQQMAQAASSIGIEGFTSSTLPTWARQRGTTALDQAMGIAASFDNNVFTVGYTQGGLDGNINGGGAKPDVFVMSHTPGGIHQWTRQIGTNGSDFGTDIAAQCNPVALPLTCSALHISGYSDKAFDGNLSAGGTDAILIKYDLSGVKQWSRQLGSNQNDFGLGIASDASGNSYIAGYTFGVLPGAVSAGNADAFLAKYSVTGTLLWVKQLGTAFADQAQAVAVDSDGNPYIGGLTFGDIDGVGPGTFQGASDAFIAKFSANGNLLWVRQFGTPQQEVVTALAASRTQTTSIFAAGYTTGNVASANAGGNDGIVLQYDTNGTEIWRRQFGGSGNDFVHGAASDGGTNVYLTGETNDNLLTGIVNPNPLDLDTYLAKYNKNGVFVLAPDTFHQLGSLDNVADGGFGVSADFDAGVYIAGRTLGKIETQVGGSDILVYRYGDGCTANTALKLCRSGGGWGDPHLKTFDGISYDFQGAGEFVIVEATDGNPFTIQGRQRPYGSSNRVTIYSGVATRIGADTVALYADRVPTLWVNGSPVSLGVNGVKGLADGGRVTRRGQTSTYVVAWPTGERLVVDVFTPTYMNVQVLLPDSRRGAVHGLYGNFNGSRQDDFELRDRTSMAQPLAFSEMYGIFADSWRITQEESLFDYLPGETTDSFTIRPFPSAPSYVSTLPPTQRTAAEAACTQVGAANPVLREACVVDVALTGDPLFVAGATNVDAQSVSVGDTEPPAVIASGAYFANFEEAIGVEWTKRAIATAPSGDRAFLGPLGDETVTLSLANLQPHTSITMSFDLIIFGGWDGEGPRGPNFWGASWGNQNVLINTTFSNTFSLQSFPGEYPNFNLPGTSATELGTLGFNNGDAVYNLVFSFQHTGPNIDLHFFASNLAAIAGAGWGIDNLDVQVH